MESPKKYTGYDKDDKQIIIAYGQDANNYINPNTVKSRINNLNKVMTEEICKIQAALLNLTKDASQALIVDTTSMTGEIEDLVLNLEPYKKVTDQAFEQVYTQSVKVHDAKQVEYNDQAKQKVSNTNGVVKVR